jgi:hypothetical protein
MRLAGLFCICRGSLGGWSLRWTLLGVLLVLFILLPKLLPGLATLFVLAVAILIVLPLEHLLFRRPAWAART